MLAFASMTTFVSHALSRARDYGDSALNIRANSRHMTRVVLSVHCHRNAPYRAPAFRTFKGFGNASEVPGGAFEEPSSAVQDNIARDATSIHPRHTARELHVPPTGFGSNAT